MIRDEEIKRLTHYAKGLGVKVIIYSKSSPDSDGEWHLDGSLIEIYSGGQSKTQTVLTLIHELGHHVWFIHEKDRQPDLKFDEAISRENLVAETDEKNITPKNLRKKIYEVEAASATWWDAIVKDTNIKISKWKINRQKEFDVWMYEMYYENGTFPKGRETRSKFKDLTMKWKPQR